VKPRRDINIVTRAPSLRTQWVSAVRDDERLTKTQQHLALLLATWMDTAGHCFPSLETIARKGHFHKFTVTQTLAALVKMDWLVKLPGGGRGRSSRYQAILNGAPASTLSPINGAPAELNGAPGRSAARHKTVLLEAPEVIEVSKEESEQATSEPPDGDSSPEERSGDAPWKDYPGGWQAFLKDKGAAKEEAEETATEARGEAAI
jgi:hypothetical protein